MHLGYTSDWMVLRYANRIMASYGTTEESMVMNKMMKDCYEVNHILYYTITM